MDLSISGTNFIGYTSVASGIKTFKTFSCKNQTENKDVFHQATPEEVDAALEKASQAVEEYAFVSMEQRKNFFVELLQLIEEYRSILVKQFCLESSLSEERANTELSRSKIQIETYLEFISQTNWNQLKDEFANGVYFQKKMFPLGVVVVFGASNFPFAYSTLGGDVISALAAGNSVIYKANPFHAGVSELCSKLILKAAKKSHLPDGVFSMIQGEEYWIGEALVKDERVKAVGFTGSIRGGVALLNYAKERISPIPIFCEMGSLNPTFIFKDALETKIDEMVEKISHAVINDAGQFCTKPGLIFALKNDFDKLENKLKETFQKAKLQPMLHPAIYNAYQKLKSNFEKYKKFQPTEVKQFYAQPTLVSMTFTEFLNSAEAKEEVFGPFSILVMCDNEGEMKQAMKLLKGHLTASVWTDENLSEEWLYLLTNSVGRVIKNGVSTGVAVIDAMHHGGAFSATSDSRFTAVGKDAIYRFLRPVTFQNF